MIGVLEFSLEVIRNAAPDATRLARNNDLFYRPVLLVRTALQNWDAEGVTQMNAEIDYRQE